jgi:mannose-6-phosphate isomerase class I
MISKVCDTNYSKITLIQLAQVQAVAELLNILDYQTVPLLTKVLTANVPQTN